MTTFKLMLRRARDRMADDRPDMLLALGRAAGVAFLAFTFLSGLVFTVWPITVSIFHYLVELNRSVNAWLWQEPTFGLALATVLNLSGTVLVLYLVRRWLALALLWAIALGESLWERARRWTRSDLPEERVSPPAPPSLRERDTAVVGG